MAIRFVPFYPEPVRGQALYDGFVRTRLLKYTGAGDVKRLVRRGMPLYKVEEIERVGEAGTTGTAGTTGIAGISGKEALREGNLIMRGECVAACAALKDAGRKVDLVYIDPPFASGADYAKKVYLRQAVANGGLTAAAHNGGGETQIIDSAELAAFEEKMYGDIWEKEKYLNWMYLNLLAIKSVMSDNASIYVHLDWHIGHYVKILLDEIFGEDNFRNEIIWCYTGGTDAARSFGKKHDVIYIYSKSRKYVFNPQYEPFSEATIKRFNKQDERGRYKGNKLSDGRITKTYMKEEGKILPDYWTIPIVNRTYDEAVEYATQKPEALLERIIKASSDEGMTVADFFGGSGVTAAVAARLGRRFIHVDVGLNSVQTARDRLLKCCQCGIIANTNNQFPMEGGKLDIGNIGIGNNSTLATFPTGFRVVEVKDGVSLYRNPVQTMDKIKSLIPGLRNEDSVDEFWEGAIHTARDGMVPVYVPNLMDSASRILDVPLLHRIVHQELAKLGDEVKRAIVYYVQVEDMEGLRRFLREQKVSLVEVELRDLKEVLDEVVVEDEAEWRLEGGGRDFPCATDWMEPRRGARIQTGCSAKRGTPGKAFFIFQAPKGRQNILSPVPGSNGWGDWPGVPLASPPSVVLPPLRGSSGGTPLPPARKEVG